jgi:very-short-patch-repair endonuclease
MRQTSNARRLRREQTDEEKQLWWALRAGRFAGFKFRRQHPIGCYILDFYCPIARLAIELDGFQHGLPQERSHDLAREHYLMTEGIEQLRFWNHQRKTNSEGILTEIWNALHNRTGCVKIQRKVENHRFRPPKPELLIQKTGNPSP